MSCWIKCLCRVYVCLGAMLPAVRSGVGGVCVQLGVHRPVPALVVSEWPEQLNHKTWSFVLCFQYSRCCLTQGSLTEGFVLVGIPWGLGYGSVMGLPCCSPQVTVGSQGALPEGGRSPGQGVQHLRLFCLWFGVVYFLYKIQHIFKCLQIGD